MTPRRKNDGAPESEPESDQPAAKTTSTRRGAKDETRSERRALLDAVASGLDDVLPGLVLLDRELVFDEGGRADLACLDEEGRLVLILLADGDANQVALVALDTLSYAARHFDLLRRHLGSPPELRAGVRTVLLAPNGGDLLLRRVTPLLEIGLEVFGMRTLSSASGERSYLVRLGASGDEEPVRESRLDSFLGRLSEASRAVCRSLVTRMQRLDEDLVADVRAREIAWRIDGRTLVRLEASSRGLLGSVEPHRRPLPIQSEVDADRLLEEAMEALLAGVAEPSSPRIVDDDERLSGLELDEPLLTAEELEAFRQ